jgi:asparagine synthase (glutamine-hydrolysing)
VLTRQMDAAVAQSKATSTIDLSPGRIPADAWRAWALPRLTLAPNHPAMYPTEQILYHYTKDLSFLARVVAAKHENRSTDFLRSPPPSPQVLECRSLIQQVLLEIVQSSDDATIDGILLSGGLDTSIIAEASPQPFESPLFSVSLDKRNGEGNPRPILRFRHAFTVQAHQDALDAQYASNIFDRLHGVSVGGLHIVKKSLDELVAPENVRPVAKTLCSFDPMELRNSLVVYAALVEARKYGVTRIVTGDGADELFCGYSFYHGMSEDKLRAYRAQIATIMTFTASTLARTLDMEVVSPFLDQRVVDFASTLMKKDLVGERTPVPVEGEGVFHGKLVLRQAFPEAFSQWRAKQPIESGAGSTALRLGFFDDKLSDSELRARQVDVFRQHEVVVRDREHLHYFDAFLAVFGGDLGNVPKRRRTAASDGDEEEKSNGFCPSCGFELSHPAQDFCVTCGFWPARANATNNGQGLATNALERLEQEKAALRAAADGSS